MREQAKYFWCFKFLSYTKIFILFLWLIDFFGFSNKKAVNEAVKIQIT
jgi:hypothetical protein